MSAIDDLVHALKGANITINVQGGRNNTMHTGMEIAQNNYRNESHAMVHDVFCSACGKLLRNQYNIAQGLCWDHQPKQMERARQSVIAAPRGEVVVFDERGHIINSEIDHRIVKPAAWHSHAPEVVETDYHRRVYIEGK